jgi:hypothetical protein
VAGKRKGRERGYNYNGQKASRRRGEDKSPAMRERVGRREERRL